ncbi:MAG: hypothetical protein WBR28_17570, partial [Mycobacterium sp.]
RQHLHQPTDKTGGKTTLQSPGLRAPPAPLDEPFRPSKLKIDDVRQNICLSWDFAFLAAEQSF